MTTSLPRLILVSPPLDDAAADGLAEALATLEDFDIASLLLRGGGLDDQTLAPRCAPLIDLAQSRDIAVLLEDRPELLAASGADGLHLDLAAEGPSLKDLRRRFGEDVILGAGCGASRHLAMAAGEQGADYIGFGELDGKAERGGAADPELIAWWEAVMTPPQVAFGANDLAEARELTAAGPDFLAVGPAFWPVKGDPAAALQSLLSALAEAAREDG